MKSLQTVGSIVITNELISKLTKIYRFKGKDFFYNEILKDDLDTTIEHTIEKDVYFLAQITNLEVSEHRIRLILKNKSKPKNNNEETLESYYQLFNIIQYKSNSFELITNEITALHKRLFPGLKADITYAKSTKIEVENGLLDKVNMSKRNILDELLEKYDVMLKKNDYEHILLLTSLYVDFINIKPYNKNNEVVGLLLIYVMLVKYQFNVFKFVSFFELIHMQKKEWDEALLQAGFNWYQGFPQITPIYRHILDFLLKGYNKVEEIVDHYEYDSKLNKSDNIENTISKLPDIFTKDDIRNEHPYVSESTINRALKRLRDNVQIKPLGTGRSAKWIKIHKEKEMPKYKE